MILFTLMVYVVLYLKKRLMKEDPLLENEEGTGKSSMSHSIEIEDDYQAHPNHDKGGDQKHKSSHNHWNLFLSVNNALWLAQNSHVTWNIQIDCLISAWVC